MPDVQMVHINCAASSAAESSGSHDQQLLYVNKSCSGAFNIP